MTITLVNFLAGLVLLYFGGEWLVIGSSAVAKKYKVRPFVIGAVVIGFGTSAPEALVSVMAQVKGATELSFGNIVGSSIANIALILGLAALIHPIKVDQGVVKWEYPFLVAVTFVLVGFSLGGELAQWSSISFLALFVMFLGWSISRGGAVHEAPPEGKPRPVTVLAAQIVVGVIGLVIGSELLVRSGVVIARHFGASELVIGTTLIAVGTSLPELAAASIAAARKEHGLALGNIIGSNVFNLLFVSGVAVLIRPIPIGPESRQILLPALILFTLALFPILKVGRAVNRKSGLLLLIGYAAFLVFLFAFHASS